MINIWETGISASVMIVAVLAFRRLVRKRISKNAMMILWDLVLARSLIPFQIHIEEIPIIKEFLRLCFFDHISIDSFAAKVERLEIGQIYEISSNIKLQEYLLWVWVVGMFLFLGRFMYLYKKEYRILKESVPFHHHLIERMIRQLSFCRKIRLYKSRALQTPVTYGVIFPKIVWPLELRNASRLDIRNMIAHELEHIRKFDVGRRVLLSIALCIHWFNPLMWLMYGLYKEDQEVACDERVMKNMKEGDADNYIYTLIKMGTEERNTVITTGFGQKHAGKRRVLEALEKRKGGGVIAVCFGICLWAILCSFPTLDGELLKAQKKDWWISAGTKTEGLDLIDPRYGGLTNMPAYDKDFDYDTVKQEIGENYSDFIENPTEEQIKMILVQNGIAAAKMYKKRQENGYVLTADQIWILEEYGGIDSNI